MDAPHLFKIIHNLLLPDDTHKMHDSYGSEPFSIQLWILIGQHNAQEWK